MSLPNIGDVSISSVQDFISSVTGGALVRATGADNNRLGAGGFLFDIIDHEEATFESDITDHYVEKNFAVQDHIAQRPMILNVKGFMGELNDVAIQRQISILTNVQSLGDIGGLAPNFSMQAAQVYAKVAEVESKINNVLNQAANIYDIFNPKATTNTRAQRAFLFFQNLWKNGLPCDVETPFGVFKNMYILRVSNINRGDTKIITDFSVTFKQIRTVDTITEVPSTKAGRASDMFSQPIQKGTVAGQKVSDAKVLDVAGKVSQ